MYDFQDIKERIENFEFSEEFDMVIAIANGGIIPAAMLNQRLGLEYNLIKFSLRDSEQKPMYDAPRLVESIGYSVEGKRILLVEDRVKSGATLNAAKAILLDKGATVVRTFAVNGKADYSLLDVPCFRFPWIL